MKSKKPITTDKVAVVLEDIKETNKHSMFDEEKINKQLDRLKELETIEDYCSKEGVLPSDLIECYKNRNKAIKGVRNDNKLNLEGIEGFANDNSGLSKMQLEIRRKKLGF